MTDTIEGTSTILQVLAQNISLSEVTSPANHGVKLPGEDTPAKLALERDLAALISRIQALEAKAITVNHQTLPDTPNEIGAPSAFADVLTGGVSARGTSAKSAAARQQLVNSLLAAREAPTGERPAKFTKVSDEELEALREHVDDQTKQLDSQKHELASVNDQLLQQKQLQEQALNILEVERVAALERELKKHQQANEAFQKALREIGEIVTAVAKGDLSKKVQIHSVEMDPEITTFKRVGHLFFMYRKQANSGTGYQYYDGSAPNILQRGISCRQRGRHRRYTRWSSTNRRSRWNMERAHQQW